MLRTRLLHTLTPFSLRLSFTFAQLSADAQRAIWACRIIKEIREAKEETDYFHQVNGTKTLKPSLAETIKGLTHKQVNCSKDELDEGIREEVLRLFTTGIQISQNMFRHEKTIDLSQGTKSTSAGSFVFYPNALVTKFMFNQMLSQPASDTISLIYGRYGIGKTMAIIMLQQLSSLVNRYYYKETNTLQSKDEFIILMRRRLIEPIPKLICYSLGSFNNQKEFVQFIKQQCTEPLSIKQDWSELKSIKDYISMQKIKKMYANRGIRIVTLFDQIDRLASNLKQFKNQQYDQGYLTQQHSKQFTIDVGNAMRQIQRMRVLKSISNHLFLNTSPEIMIDLKDSSYVQQNQQLKKAISIDQTKIICRKLPYHKNVMSRWGQISLSHCVWFQIQKKLVSLRISPQAIDRMQVMYYQKLDKRKDWWPHYLGFKHIHETLFPSDPSVQSPLSNIDENSFMDKLQQALDSMDGKSKKIFLHKIQDMVGNASYPDRRFFLRYLYILNKYAEGGNLYTDELFRVQIKDLSDYIVEPIKSFQKYQKFGVELFSCFQQQKQGQVFATFCFSPIVFLEYTNYLLCIFVQKNFYMLQGMKNRENWLRLINDSFQMQDFQNDKQFKRPPNTLKDLYDRFSKKQQVDQE